MPLTLVLGPANSAKAGEVLGAYAAAAPRGALLVVPTALDAEHYARELAAPGALLGSVQTFSGLVGEIARRAGFVAARLSERQRERLVSRAVARAGLRRLAASAASAGFAPAVGALVAELQRALVSPDRFAGALRDWAGADGGRRAYGAELAALYAAYERECDAVGRVDGDRFAWRALDALREAPGRWGDTPVFFYGFDDLHPLQRDAIETLCTLAGVEVTVSLTYEPGRAALAARAETVAELRPLAGRVVPLEASEEMYAPEARGALHHLERHLFEPGAPRRPGGTAVGLLEAGGARAEAELLAAEVLELQRSGVPGHEIAVVVRSLGGEVLALEQVFAAYGIEVAVPRPRPLGHVALGRALLALARCAWGDGGPADLLDYLRAPGLVATEVVDGFQARLRRAGAASLNAAVALSLGDEKLRAAVAVVAELADSADPAQALGDQARRLLVAHGAGQAPRLDGAAGDDARACAALLQALAELREVDPGLGGDALLEAVVDVPVAADAPVRPGAVLISDPLSIRARRFDAVLIAGLQESVFPRPGVPEPFLSDEVRRELAEASGLRLRAREDALDSERYLFYAVASRARRRLVLSFCSSDEEGNLSLASPFLRDAADVLDVGWWERRRRRLLADVVWDPEEAPTARERDRALVAVSGARSGSGAPAGAGGVPSLAEAREEPYRLSEAALAQARHRDVVSAGALEAFAQCPVRWLIERQLEPDALEPTAEPLVRGSYMHAVLERVVRDLGEAVTEGSLDRALELLDRAMDDVPGPLGDDQPAVVRAAARQAIAADLRRYLRHEARAGCAWAPQHLEQRFGFCEDEGSLAPLQIGEGASAVRLRGVIDRIDVDPSGRRAIVRDYKSGSVGQDHQASHWADGRQLQVALYMLAVRELLGLEPVAGLYQPLRGGELRPRGAFLRDACPEGRLFAGDGCEPEQLDALLADARARAVALALQLRSGDVTPQPATCSRDGCRYPGICRGA